MSVDFERNGRCADAASGTPGVANGLFKHCGFPNMLTTPSSHMPPSGQQVAPIHMAGLMPNVYPWGPLADPLCPR